MKAQVTLGLDEFDKMREEIQYLTRQLTAVNKALKSVYNTDRDTLCNQASEMEERQAKYALREAVHTGKF